MQNPSRKPRKGIVNVRLSPVKRQTQERESAPEIPNAGEFKPRDAKGWTLRVLQSFFLLSKSLPEKIRVTGFEPVAWNIVDEWTARTESESRISRRIWAGVRFVGELTYLLMISCLGAVLKNCLTDLRWLRFLLQFFFGPKE